VGTGDQQVLDKIFIFHSSSRLTRAPPPLGLIVRQGLGFGITTVRDSDHPVLLGNQVLHRKVMLGSSNLRAPLIAVVFHDLQHFLSNYLLQTVSVSQNLKIFPNFRQLFLVFLNQLFVLEASEPVQSQFQDSLGLCGRKKVPALAQAILRFEFIGAASFATRPLQHPGHFSGQPVGRDQFFFCF